MIDTLLPPLTILTGVMLLVLVAHEGLRSLRTARRFGTRGDDPRLARAATPAAYWSALVLFGLVMGRAGTKFIEVGLTEMLAR